MKDPNKLRIPQGKSEAFAKGWRACEAGDATNPYPLFVDAARNTPEQIARAHDWTEGYDARAEIGFETAHLPRKLCSDAFAF